MTTAVATLALHGVTKRFGGVTAVDKVNLSVPTGQIRAVIGPNGAGKTTLLNLITGHLARDEGDVVLQGRPLRKLSPDQVSRAGVARTFQVSGIFPHLTVFQNVQVAWLAAQGRSFDIFSAAGPQGREPSQHLLDRVGLLDQQAKTAGILPHGDKKRLELAMVLASRPVLLLMDEPTAGMAAQEKQSIVPLVERIAREQNLTVVFTEHDMDVVFGIADEITVMHQGAVIAQGGADAIKRNDEVRRVYLGQAFDHA